MTKMKKLRADNTYMLRTESTDNPKLGAKVLADRRESLFLDFNFGYSMQVSTRSGKTYPKKKRRRLYLRLYLLPNPRTPEQRLRNRHTIDLAKKIRFDYARQLLGKTRGYSLPLPDDVNFLDWMQTYADTYTKTDIAHIRRARAQFIKFLSSTAGYEQFAAAISPSQMSRSMIEEFASFLSTRFVGEGAHTLFARFKKIVKAAVGEGLFAANPCDGVSIKTDSATLRKEILTLDEIRLLAATHYRGENTDIRRAFLFSCYTGLRWCDVRALTAANIDTSARLLRFEQQKTGHFVVIPLNDSLLSLIYPTSNTQHPIPNTQHLLFPLPGRTMCLKALRRWVRHAGIPKHITWHCARHSFAVNILNGGANIKTVSGLLGHTSLRHTEKYTRLIDALKQHAIDSQFS